MEHNPRRNYNKLLPIQKKRRRELCKLERKHCSQQEQSNKTCSTARKWATQKLSHSPALTSEPRKEPVLYDKQNNRQNHHPSQRQNPPGQLLDHNGSGKPAPKPRSTTPIPNPKRHRKTQSKNLQHKKATIHQLIGNLKHNIHRHYHSEIFTD